MSINISANNENELLFSGYVPWLPHDFLLTPILVKM